MKQLKVFSILLAIVVIAVFVGCKSAALTSAKLYIQQENYPKALEQLQQEVAQNPANDEAYYLIGYVYAAQGKFTEMDEAFKSSLDISNKYAKEIDNIRKKYWVDNFNLGVRKLQNNQYKEAIENFKTAAIIDPSNADTYKDLAFAYVRLDSHTVATEYYQKALEIAPEDTKSMLYLGMEYYNLKEYEKAIDILEKLLDKEPTNNDAISYLAISYDLIGQGEKALTAYDNALKQNPNDADLYYNRGRLYYMRDDMEKAANDFEKVAELTPNDYEALFNLGNTYLNIGESYQKKRQQLEDENGDETKITDLKQKELANYENAKKYLERARDIDDSSANLWNNLAITYVRLGMPEEGKEAFKKAEELEKQ